ncbi:MAG TPA: 30S ribosomal protein S6 [Candidatus Blackburnbacteria bacterium]|nr:30S ribosomal protein S6 [Candidatus Blackburnbacteria bacterium]
MYELTVILSSKLADAKQKAVLEKIEKTAASAGGSFEKTEKWGIREFAYPIKHESEGVYYFIIANLPSDKVGSFDRLLQNDDQILRHLIIKTDKAKVEKSEKEAKKTETEKEPDPKSKSKTKVKSKKATAKKTAEKKNAVGKK